MCVPSGVQSGRRVPDAERGLTGHAALGHCHTQVRPHWVTAIHRSGHTGPLPYTGQATLDHGNTCTCVHACWTTLGHDSTKVNPRLATSGQATLGHCNTGWTAAAELPHMLQSTGSGPLCTAYPGPTLVLAALCLPWCVCPHLSPLTSPLCRLNGARMVEQSAPRPEARQLLSPGSPLSSRRGTSPQPSASQRSSRKKGEGYGFLLIERCWS